MTNEPTYEHLLLLGLTAMAIAWKDQQKSADVNAMPFDERLGLLVDAEWIDNGPGWVGVLLSDAAAVLACRPDPGAFGSLDIGVVGPYPAGSDVAVEVRAFCPGLGVVEDPVTGSLNAGLAQWLAGNRLPTSYVASQGTVLGRQGRVHVSVEGDGVWIGGDTLTSIAGTVDI